MGFFPVWMVFYDKDGKEINELSGFWSDIALNVDLFFDFICHHASFGTWERDGFCFYPYKTNGCKNYFHAIIKLLFR